jgi:hypothetical protein
MLPSIPSLPRGRQKVFARSETGILFLQYKLFAVIMPYELETSVSGR